MEIRKSIIGRESDVYEYMVYESRNKDASYRIREGYWDDFVNNKFLRPVHKNEKFITLMEEFQEITVEGIPKYLRKIRERSNLVTLIELCEIDHKSFFLFGNKTVIRVFSGLPTKNDEEMIEIKFLTYSFKFLFEEKLKNLNLASR